MNAKIILAAIVAVVLLSGGFVYLSGSNAQHAPYKIALNTWVGYAPFYLAEEKGFYKEEGVDVQLLTIDSVSEQKASILSDRIDAIGSTVDVLTLWRAQGLPIVAVMQPDVSNGADGVLATNDILSIKDLKGKRVAAQKNFVSESFLFYLLKKNNLSPKDVEIIDMEAGAAGAAFVAGAVDVAVTWEPWLSKAAERSNGKILVTSRDIPGVLVDVLTPTENALKNRRADTKKVMRAWFKAVDYAKTHPKEANEIMAKHYAMSPQEFEEIIAGANWPSLQENKDYLNASKPNNIFEVGEVFAGVFVEVGSIKEKPDLRKAVDASLLNEIL